jgi:hypothetical protein
LVGTSALARSELDHSGLITAQPSWRELSLRQAYQRVQRLTRLGLHAEAHAVWESEIQSILRQQAR